MSLPLPDRSIPLLDADGVSINQVWFDYFAARQTLTSASDVSPTSPTNLQVLKWITATKLWTPT